MPRFDPLQNAFVAGELTPRLEGRDDIRQYAQGMRQSVNQLVLPQGAVMHRSGTQFESETKGSGPVILRPFEVGLDQAYILEMGDEYMRFHANEGRLEIATIVNAVNFDASTYLSEVPLAGISNTPYALVSLWFNILGGDGTDMRLVANSFSELGGESGIDVFRAAGGNLNIIFNDLGTANFTVEASSQVYDTTSNPGWHHLLIAADLVANSFQMYIDDVLDPNSTTPSVLANNISWETGAVDTSAIFDIGRENPEQFPVSVGKFIGDMAEVYVNTQETLDLSNILNRRKFIDGAGKPVGLGLQGDNPTGSQPMIFLSGATVDWHTNKGSGFGFTETGALTDATTSPSD